MQKVLHSAGAKYHLQDANRGTKSAQGTTQSIRHKFISLIQRSNRFSSSSNWTENFSCKILILSCATQEASHTLCRRFLFHYCFPSSSPHNILKSLEQYFVSGLVIKISLLRAVQTVKMLRFLSFLVPFFMWWYSSVNTFCNRSAWLAYFSIRSFSLKNPHWAEFQSMLKVHLQSWRARECKTHILHLREAHNTVWSSWKFRNVLKELCVLISYSS